MKGKWLLSLIMALPLCADYDVIEDQNRLEIKTPALSDRQTEKIRLKNGLEAYLISDPGADQSGAGLSVEVGSWSDPKEYPGMAHFLEHMLFMGNEAYPQEDGFFSFVFDHGGLVNAYTMPDRTVYMFSINNNDLESALDQFSHFFIDPLFMPSGIGRELHAVDQENDKNIENDSWRQWMIIKETGNQKHPNATFSTGNAQTLGNIPQSALKTWYQNHYNARQMHLVVYSPLPLDQMKAMVVKDFSPITNTPLPKLPNVAKLTSENQEGHIIYVKPIKDLRRLELTWELPPEYSNDLETKSADLLAFILSSEAEGSLLSELKREELAESLAVGVEQISKEANLFMIQIGLTKYGTTQVDRVIERSFQMLNLVKEEGIAPFYYDEMQRIKQIAFNYQSRESAFDYVRSASHQLVDEPIETYPQKSVVASHFDASKTEKLVRSLTPENCLFFVIAPPELTGVQPTKKERWLGGEYAVKKVPSNMLTAWGSQESHPHLQMPHRNPFLPGSLDLVDNENVSKPQLIADSAYGSVYYAPDNQYHVPEVSFILSFRSPLIDGSARQTALSDLYIKSLSEMLSSPLSYAGAAGLSAELSLHDLALTLEVDGYSDKAPLLLQDIVKQMKSVSPTPDQFELYRDSLLSSYENRAKAMPFVQAGEVMGSLLFNDRPTNADLASSVRQISYDDFLAFSEKLLLQSYVEGLLVGNLQEERAKLIWQNLRSSLTFAPYAKEDQHKREILSLPTGNGPFMVMKETPMQGSAVMLAVEESPFNFEKRASQLVFESAIRPDFFATLRTKQQTAYIAKSWSADAESQLLQFLAVQSSTHQPEDLLARFELFLEDYSKDFLSHISESRFEEIRASLTHQLTMPPPNLAAFTRRQYRFAFKEEGNFNFIQDQIAALQKLTYKELHRDAKEFFSRKNTRRVAVLLQGASPEGKEFRYKDVTAADLKTIGTYVTKN